MPRAKETAGLRQAPEMGPNEYTATIKRQAIETPPQVALPASTLQPTVKVKRNVPANS